MQQKSQCSNSFNSKEYLQTYYSRMELDLFREVLFKDFFQKYKSKWDVKSARLLDFSGGAVILNYVSAAPHVAEIVHAAYTQDERREIELWKNNDEGAYDWIPYIKQVVQEIEGLEGDTAWQERVKILRSKIKVVSCNNINETYPIDPVLGKDLFSIVCTSYTLEVTSKTLNDLKMAVKKLVKLLRLGGYLVILLDEDESFYLVGEKRIPVLPVSLDQLKEAVEEAGCVILMTERETTPIDLIENPTVTDEKASVFVAAYKVKQCIE